MVVVLLVLLLLLMMAASGGESVTGRLDRPSRLLIGIRCVERVGCVERVRGEVV